MAGKYKRIYLGAGSTLLGLFLILTLVGMQITSDGNQVCAGTLEDPCISYLTFTNPTAKSIYIYNKEDIKLDFSPEIKDYELYVKYYGKWVPMNFTMDTRLSNVPDDRLYTFVFPRYSTKEFKLVGYKNNPSDVIKWGMGVGNDYLDPYWLSTDNYIIDGDKVYVNDSKIYLSAEPRTLRSTGYVELELESKVYTGDVTVAFGFPSDSYKPTGFDRWNPKNVTVQKNYTCDYDFGYTLTPEKRAWCYIQNSNSSIDVIFNHTFDSGSIQTKTVYWSETIEDNWSKISVDTTKIMFEHEGVDTWRIATGLPIIEDELYKARVKIDIPMYKHQYEKYWICIYPSSYGRNIYAANSAEHLYCLDPAVAPSSSENLAYWALEDLTDLTADEHNLTNSGGVTNGTTGILDNCYSFDGIDDYLYADGNISLEPDYVTLNAWVKTSASGTNFEGIIDRWTNTHEGYLIDIGSGTSGSRYPRLITSDTTKNYAVTATTTIDDGNWHMITGTFDGTNIKIYVDGSLEDTTAFSGVINYVANNDIKIGGDGVSTNYFEGDIDEVSIFNVSLSIDEIIYLNASGSPSLAQQYPFISYYANFSVSINSPDNNSFAFDKTPDFNFTVNGTESTYNCNLYINGTKYGVNASCSNNTATVITANASLANNIYYFNVMCVQNFTTNFSVNRTFTIKDYTLSGTLKYSNGTAVNGSASDTFIRIINQSNNATLGMTSVNSTGGFSYGEVPTGTYGVSGRTNVTGDGGGFSPHIIISEVAGWFT